MTGTAFAFNWDVVGDPSYTARQLRQMMVAPFVAMGSSARPLGAKSGIRVGTPSNIASITGTGPYSYAVQPFVGVIDAEPNAAAAPYTYSFPAAETGPIDPAGSVLRVDRLDVVLSDEDEGDSSATRTVQLVRTPGASTGSLPPAAPARSHFVAYINMPTSGAPTIQWAPEWSGSPGHWTFNTYAEMKAYSDALTATNVPLNQRATVIADTTTANNGDYVWGGSAWSLQNGTQAIIVRRSSTGVSGGANVWQQLTTAGWWSQDYNNGFATFDGTIVAPVTGWYRLFIGMSFSTSAPATLLMVTKNNASNTETGNILRQSVAQVAGEAGGYTSKLVKLAAGDVLRFQIFPTGSWVWGTDPDDGVFGLELAHI